MTKRKLRLTRRKIDRAVLALEALLAADLPETQEFGGRDAIKAQIEAVLWDAVHPLYQAVPE